MQARNVMRHIAAFHKYQLCLSEQEWKKWDAIPAARRFWIDDFMGKSSKMVLDMIENTAEFQEGSG